MSVSIYLPLILLIKETISVQQELYFNKQEGDQGTVDRNRKLLTLQVTLRSYGIFDSFVQSLLHVLTTAVPRRKLRGYLLILSRGIGVYDYKYTKKLAKYLKELSKEHKEEIVDELLEIREELKNYPPRRKEFIDLLNPVYTLKENLVFNHYILDLKDYCKEDKLFIDEETKKMLHFIIDPIRQLSRKDQDILEHKLKKAYKEYKDEFPYRLLRSM